ncbi:hypothetical protein [Streptomyces hygroscopicus]|uniref:hypothetical protein n=1 Tax=Streptomyces hygroscopicus TaxID=1912 RepID=UPI001FCB8F38|nr:hypothetical protein [Streptomyces hygroscopicus]BDH10530.1 hypothetical protein HOK021_17090 [Streptomyces hygroscopicus]
MNLAPIVLPNHFLQERETLAALAARDFNGLFKLLHKQKVSYGVIAAACGLKTERVSLIARGKAHVTHFATVEKIADGLRIPGDLIGLARRPWEEATASPETHKGVDQMKRRQLLQGAVAAGLSGTPINGLASSRNAVDRALERSAGGDLDYWELLIEQYSYGYQGKSPAEVEANLAKDIEELRPLLETPLPVVDRIRLCRIAAQIAGIAAIVLHDRGERSEARKWFLTAGRAAEESGDRSLHAWVLARHAMVPLNFGAPQAAIPFVEQARHLAGTRPTAAAALSAVVAARAHALIGHRDQAFRALHDADRLAARLGSGQRTDTWFGYSEQKRHVHLSHAHTTLGSTHQARASQERALELSSPSGMTRGLLQLDAATCWHREGDTERACRAATATLADLPPGWRTGLTRTRALDLYRSVPPQHHNEPAVRELRDSLAGA